MHWYLAVKEKKFEIFNEASYLNAFTYETRVSSKRFCQHLIKNPIENLDSGIQISSEIIDSAWFMASWKSDPTIQAILNMLDSIHSEMSSCDDGLYNKLTNNNIITFEYINIKSSEFKLTDELYIKMNSRGKPLTKFENFKAQLSDLFSEKSTDYSSEKLRYEDSDISYLQYFAFRIDGHGWIYSGSTEKMGSFQMKD